MTDQRQPHKTADERDALANARDAQADADTLRRQAARMRQPAKARMLGLAEKLELESAGWLGRARTSAAKEMAHG